MLTKPTPLPSNPFGSDPPQLYQAYQSCLDLESMAYTSRALQCSKPPGLIAARLLGHLLVRSENGYETLAREIINASSDTKLLELARYYMTHFVKVCMYRATSEDHTLTILPVKRARGPTSALSEDSSHASSDSECDALASVNNEASLNREKAKKAVRSFLFLSQLATQSYY